ncbi:hypothetical protein Q9L42_009195 [Methylomarinum sp. Ch1-1]|uniref:DUF4347 domain-containing protein n=1 Tax=Methylomarinum roseum TaxID=3067653 RepID=A0AAU7NYY7_9GAMM|nr:hypothetical protein [Methylomarinum sp. Ch1-1]MDP4521590.1 hypothetical protein [Methylomarinum sp. Ch1-1]
MDILAGDFQGGLSQGSSLFNGLMDALASQIRGTNFRLSVDETVQIDGISSFVEGVLDKSGGQQVEHLYILDHGYEIAGAGYKATLDGKIGAGRNWSRVQVEFGSTKLGHSNFRVYQPQLQKLQKVLGRGSHVVFLNCSVGKDAALLSRLATLWQCSVSGPTALQAAGELINMLNLKDGMWTTAHPGKNIRQTRTHPVWGTSF